MPCKASFFASCAGSGILVYAVLQLCLREMSFQEADQHTAEIAPEPTLPAPVHRYYYYYYYYYYHDAHEPAEGTMSSAGSSEIMPPVNGTFRTLDVKRIAWLHPPKVGSSFVNTLFGHACPGMKNDEYITRKMYDVIVLFKIKEIPDEWQCPFLEDGSRALDLHCSHKAITWQKSPCNYWGWSKDHFIMILRQPEQRILSGFVHDKHGAGANMSHLTQLEYATIVQGCMVRMLLGWKCYDRKKMNISTVTDEHITKAIKHLDEGFAFVGILEEIELCVCLFHAIFGGVCRSAEFVNIRPAYDRIRFDRPKMGATADHDISVLKGWFDRIDRPLYDHAVRVVHSNMDKYGVNRDSCISRVCPCCPEAFPSTGLDFVPELGP